jgi:type I restriction enzyme S subunit
VTGVKLRRIATAVNGTGFPHAFQGRKSGYVPFFKVSDFHLPGNERYLKKCTNWITPDEAVALGARIAPSQSILLPKVVQRYLIMHVV